MTITEYILTNYHEFVIDLYSYTHSNGMWHKAEIKVEVLCIHGSRNKNCLSSLGISPLKMLQAPGINPSPLLY